jgi:hypothetical protein
MTEPIRKVIRVAFTDYWGRRPGLTPGILRVVPCSELGCLNEAECEGSTSMRSELGSMGWALSGPINKEDVTKTPYPARKGRGNSRKTSPTLRNGSRHCETPSR